MQDGAADPENVGVGWATVETVELVIDGDCTALELIHELVAATVEGEDDDGETAGEKIAWEVVLIKSEVIVAVDGGAAGVAIRLLLLVVE